MFLKLVFTAGLISSAFGHGRLYWPPSRSTMWRHGFDNPPNYTDHELSCGGYGTQHITNGGMCGECGDAWNIPVGQRPNQAGGTYANGIITDTYKSGDVIDIDVQLTANHIGYFEFRLCVNNNPSRSITWDCLNQHLLEMADGSGTRFPAGNSYGMKHIKARLPAGVTCTQCVLQWRYRTGNRWDCADDEGCCLGCGPQEEFYGCSDIAITGDGGPAPSTTAGSTSSSQATTTTTRATTTSSASTTSSSGTTTTRPPSSGNCRATGIWEGLPDKDAWCNENCNHVPPNCSPEICICE